MNNSINVEEIMESIRREIREKGYTDDTLSFREVAVPARETEACYDAETYRNTLANLESAGFVQWKVPLEGGIRGFIKKVIRKLIGFLFHIVTEQQNSFNQQTVSEFRQLEGYIEKQQQVIEDYECRITELEDRLHALEEKRS